MARYVLPIFALVVAVLAGCEDTVIVDNLTGEDLVDPSIMPMVIYSYPGSGSGPFEDFDRDILVRFNKLMDPGSLKKALHISSPTGGMEVDTARIPSAADHVYSIRVVGTEPNASLFWKIGETYTLLVDSTARDINGNSLRVPYALNFTPEPHFRVVNFTPAPGSDNVSVKTNIVIRFNNSVDTTMYQHLHISPDLVGSWTMPYTVNGRVDSTRIRFRRSGVPTLPSGTTYSVWIDSALSDVDGHTLGMEYSAVFTTTIFGVTGTSPPDGSENQTTWLSFIRVTFNEAVDFESIDSSISVTPFLPWSIYNESGSSSVNLYLQDLLPTGSEITVTIDTTLRSVSGARLPGPYSFRFLTENFRVTGPVKGIPPRAINRYDRIYVYFNGSLDTGTVRESVSIEPPHPVFFILSSPVSSFAIAPITGFTPKTSYTIMVDSSVKSMNGQSLEQSHTFSIVIAPFRLTSANPSDGSTMEPRYRSLYFYFNDYLDTSSVAESFSVEPAVPGHFVLSTYTSQFQSFAFQPEDSLTALTMYTVTIDTSIRTRDGYRLDAPVIVRFSTGY